MPVKSNSVVGHVAPNVGPALSMFVRPDVITYPHRYPSAAAREAAIAYVRELRAEAHWVMSVRGLRKHETKPFGKATLGEPDK